MRLRKNVPSAMLAFSLVLAAAPAEAEERNPWVGAWGYAASPATGTPAPPRPAGTFRYRMRLSQSGVGIALRFSNPENALPLVIARVSVATASADAPSAITKPEVELSFRGATGTTVAAGASISTDPGRLAVREGEDVIVTFVTTSPSTDVAGNAGFRSEFTSADASASTVASRSRPFVSLVSVHNRTAPCTIVTLGDSITEGARGKQDGWRGWPGRLAERLIAEQPGRHCGVVNMGISGNRLLAYGRGPSGIDRFGRDVLAVPGVTHVVLLEGVNDIALSTLPTERKVAAADLIAGYKKVIAMSHEKGLRVIGATLTPAGGSRFNTADLERIRAEANDWIRRSGSFDGVIDFEAALTDGTTPPALKPAFDSGDKLHPGDVGYAAMAAAVQLELFSAPSDRVPSKSQ